MNKLIYFLIVIFLFSCKKDPKSGEPAPDVVNYIPPPPITNEVVINITNVADNTILQVSKDTVYTGATPKYINANTDTFSVTTFKYYISNIRLKKTDGSYYSETESYHLINAADTGNTCKFSLKNIPYGNYISIEYIIGVDSTRNCSGAQSGALSATNDMFWSWNQGYIFLKFEGYTSSGIPSAVHNIEYHIGGFKAPYNNIKKVVLPLTSPNIIAGSNTLSKIYLKANIKKCFENSLNNISFSVLQIAASPASGTVIANNYVNLFSVAAIVN